MQPFFRFVRSRINTISREMAERSVKYQFNVTGKPVTRHTPISDQRMYISANILDQIDAMVNTTTYHDEPLKYADVEAVTYWQAIGSPNMIAAAPSVMNADGTVEKGTEVTIPNIMGVIFDRDAIGVHYGLYDVDNTPYNPKGGYYNTWLTANLQYTNDLTEKGVILLLD